MYVIDGVFCPLVNVPPFTLQLYVAPEPAFGTDATLPLEFRQATPAVIVQFAVELIGTVFELVHEQPLALVSVTEMATAEPDPAA